MFFVLPNKNLRAYGDGGFILTKNKNMKKLKNLVLWHWSFNKTKKYYKKYYANEFE